MSTTEFGERIRKLSPAKLVLLAEHLSARVTALETAAREPIAIVGIGCRFPGGVDGPESFWQLLCDGVDAIREVPRNRWDADALYDPDPDAPGTMSTRWGGFLDDVDLFDPGFFGIAPREAGGMDPQQRLLLEVAWEALERAGVPGDALAGSATGVFVGLSGSDYFNLQMQNGLAGIDTYLASGTAHSIASGRLAYVLGTQGPAVSVDTACSSSLVAVHSAVLSLRAGECNLALAGGVNLILSPVATIALSKAHMMAPDGRCKAFDARANGFVRSEGAAMLVLKRLSDAVAAGDPIVAVIRGSAINQDGRSNGLTAPNGPAQESVIRAALANGGVTAAQVGFVESHGTGTSLGDPIEVRALAAVLGRDRDASRPVLVGSVKTNIGHLESAAGVAGLIKAALMVQRGRIPPHLHLERLNPFIPWDEIAVRVPTTLTPWNEAGERIAGVSSFGFSGSNAHIVLGEAPPVASAAPSSVERPLHVLSLSARSEPALKALVARVEGDLDLHDARFADVCHTFGAGRAQFSHRLAVVAASAQAARMELSAYLGENHGPRTVVGHLETPRPPKVVFLFTGQGAQYVGMGRRLYETAPVFRDALDRCAAILAGDLDRPLLSVLFGANTGDGTLLSQTRYTQPAMFAVQYSLAALWQSWGVIPAAVMGHSVGEYAAACIAGACSLEDGLKLIAARGRLMQSLPAGGAMAAVFADSARVEPALQDGVDIAAFNGPDNLVISGPAEAVAAVLATLRSDGVQSQPLDVAHAFHSVLMTPIVDEFARVAATISFGQPRMTLVSNVTGEVASQDVALPGYWAAHIRKPVQFAGGIHTLRELGYQVFVEIGPHPVLVAMASRWIDDPGLLWLPSLRRDHDDWEQMATALSSLYAKGVAVDWSGFDAPYQRRRLPLSTYPFQRTRHWTPPPFSPTGRATEGTAVLGARLTAPPADDRVGRTLFEVQWDAQPLPVASEQRAAAGFLLTGAAVAADLDADVRTTYERHGLSLFERILPELDVLCAAYVTQALSRLGWSFRAGQQFTSGAVMERCGILDRHRRLLGRMLEMLEEDGWLKRTATGWIVERAPVVVDTASVARTLVQQFPEARAEFTMTVRCGEHLAEALSGAVDPLQLLFPNGSLEDAESLYQHSPVARTFNALVEQALVSVLAAVPADRTIRIVEIGAGTGGTTSAVLPRLPADRTEYLFTDASRLFSSAAAEKFSAYPFVKFGKLDIGADPQQQGFAAGSFDIVIAANVLHATPDLRRTLSHVRGLLAPGGLMLLLEAGSKERYADLTVGLTEGWWAFTDGELRPDHALLSGTAWRALLGESGFTDVATVPREGTTGVLGRQAVVMATVPRTADSGRATMRRWVLFADGSDGELASRALAADGDSVTLVGPGAAFERVSDARYVIDPLAGEDYSHLLDEVVRGDGGPVTVVHMWSLATRMPAELTPASLEESQQLASASALRLAQALTARARGPVFLSLVTQGGQVTGSDDGARAALAQSTVWGLSHTIAIEHPELRCRRIDLDPTLPVADQVDHLVDELRTSSSEDQIAWRGPVRQVRRLVWSTLNQTGEPVRFASDASYLITGGVRGLGLVIARWMADRGARHLVLLGRRGMTDASRPAVEELRADGVAVHVVTADVADRAQLAAVFDQIDESLPPLRGVVHSAGAVDDAVLAQQTWSHLARVMAAKVLGSWNLHESTRGRTLDFVALFSTGVSLLGSGGQANHAAANAFVDVLAPWLRAAGLPAVAINWGAWAEVGAAVGRRLSADHKGVRRMSTADGLDAFERVLRPLLLHRPSAPSQVAVLAADWPEFFTQFADAVEPPLYRYIAHEERRRPGPGASEPAAPAAKAFVAVLADALPGRRLALLRTHIRQLTAKVLGVADPAAIELQQPLHDLGLDSLMSIQLRNQLSTSLDRTLPATLLYEQPTVMALADYLLLEGTSATGPALAVSSSPAADTSAADDDRSEADLADALLARLDQIGQRLS